MMQFDAQKTVVVFDLDDTLYYEHEFHLSGFNAIYMRLRDIFPDIEKKEVGLSDNDLLDEICKAYQLPSSVKESLLWLYRLHLPAISLSESTRDVLRQIERSCKSVAVLTDGRSITQRQKLKALGLLHLPIYISEEHGSEKPSPDRFLQIMRDFPAEAYIYVGDNPRKDFYAPNLLGWTSIGLLGDGKNIHPQNLPGLSKDYLPTIWISNINDLLGFLC
jgi:putative hydrolase of the HAD superfamily